MTCSITEIARRIRPYPQVLPMAETGEGVFERDERRMGRSHWTVEDYRQAGREWFDRVVTIANPTQAQREKHANCWVAMNCPPSKLRASLGEIE